MIENKYNNLVDTQNVNSHCRYDALDGLRTVACLGIVLMHVKSNIGVKPSASWFVNNVISFTSDFVLMFMMISAFGLCCGYYDKFLNGKISLNRFYGNRYRRVLPFFALLITIDVFVCFLTEHFAFSEVSKAELWEGLTDLTLAYGLMPGCKINVVGVGWFLGVIFLFYMLFPFYTFLIKNKKNGWFVLFVSIFLYIVLKQYFAPAKGVFDGQGNFITCIPFFVVGGLLYLYRTEIMELMTKPIARAALLISTIGYTVWFFIYPEMRFTLANLVMYGLWVAYAISEAASNRKWTLLNNKVMAFISGISMEIYLCHMMFFRVVEKLHLENKIENNDVHYWLTCTLVLLAAGCFGWCWKIFEKKYIR